MLFLFSASKKMYARGRSAPFEFINKTQLRRFIFVYEVTGRIGTPEIIRRRNVDGFTELRYCFDMEIILLCIFLADC